MRYVVGVLFNMYINVSVLKHCIRLAKSIARLRLLVTSHYYWQSIQVIGGAAAMRGGPFKPDLDVNMRLHAI